MTQTFIDIHVLQTVPPSNMNRDDTGSPKTAFYGGVRRARVSSQAWKRATRKAFDGLLDRDQLGVRTKRVVKLVAERITEKAADVGGDPAEHAAAALVAAGIKLEAPRKPKEADSDWDGRKQSGYLLFLSRSQVDQLADLAITAARTGSPIDKKAAKAAADTRHSVDVSLFGRMVADASELNVDAAAQVAHAISVHAVDNEFDYFTAVDDEAPEDNVGAGMIGTVEFNSSTLYRYATLNVEALRKNLGNDEVTARAAEAFVRAFITSMPTGKQNTFANRTLPDAIFVAIRHDQPVNLAGAYEEAVEAADGSSRLARASDRLVQHSQAVDSAYGNSGDGLVLLVAAATDSLAALGQAATLDQLVEAVGRAANEGARSMT